MDEKVRQLLAHPAGELERAVAEAQGEGRGQAVEPFGGRIFVRWDAEAAVTAFGPVSYFIEFLKANGLWPEWVKDCPLSFTSPNAPPKKDILGTILLSVLAGHKRYAHVTAIRSDSVTPGLLGMERVRSEDAIRRAFLGADPIAYADWGQTHLEASYEELLCEPWIMDIDGTVKPLYGNQEQAVRGYNPVKHGRPSHVYQTYFIAAIRMILDVEVQPGNQTASQYAQPGLWAWLDRRPRDQWPALLRGDIAWGTERMMEECEERGLSYLFKLRQTTKVKRHIAQLFDRRDWEPAGGDWQGLSSELQLTGWTKKRRVVILRRLIRESLAVIEDRKAIGQGNLFGAVELLKTGDLYEYAVLITPIEAGVIGIAQLYRDRAESENVFDEMKNQWGWSGFTTHDQGRCQIMARINALIYNWWSLFTRLAIPNRHSEATTTRPLLLHGIARQTKHGNQTTLTITSNHAQAPAVQRALETVSQLLQQVARTAGQLTLNKRWRWLLRFIFRDWLKTQNPDPAFLPLNSLVNCRI